MFQPAQTSKLDSVPQSPLATSFFSKALNSATTARSSLSSLVVLSAIAVGAAGNEVKALWAHNAQDLARTTSYGAEKLQGIAVWYTGRLNNGQPYIANGTLYDSTTIIGAAHTTPSRTSTATIEWVGTSLNYNQPELGQVRRAVSWERHPTYGGIPGINDISKILVDVPFDLTQFPNRPNGPLSIATVGLNEQIIIGGYGRFGSPDTGSFESDGQLRGGNMLSTPNTSATFQGTIAGKFELDLIDLNVNGLPSLSGGSGINTNGEYVGPVVGGTANPITSGFTYFTPAAQYTSWIPEPSSLIVLGGAAVVMGRRPRQPNATAA